MERSIRDLVIARVLTLMEDDWVPACALASLVSNAGVTVPSENRAACLLLIEEAITNGWIRVGELRSGFEDWDSSVVDVMLRLGRAWPTDAIPALGHDPCWFDLTPAGREKAEALAERFGSDLAAPFGSYYRISVKSP